MIVDLRCGIIVVFLESGSLPTYEVETKTNELSYDTKATFPFDLNKESLVDILHRLNWTDVSRDSRMSEKLVDYFKERRNKTIAKWKARQQARLNKTANIVNNTTNKAASNDEDYDYDEDYPDFDFSPASIFIFVLELFGGLIGLTWGAISTIFQAG